LLPNVEMASSAMGAFEGADAAILVTEWPEFAKLDWAEVLRRMNTPLLVDGRNFLDGDAISAAGITYEAIGRPSAVGRSAVIREASGREAEEAER
jgi:UDPglucose 6-dehydrogenase